MDCRRTNEDGEVWSCRAKAMLRVRTRKRTILVMDDRFWDDFVRIVFVLGGLKQRPFQFRFIDTNLLKYV